MAQRPRGVGVQVRPNDIYTMLLLVAAVFLLLATALLAVEQYTFYGGLFPPPPKDKSPRPKACAPGPPVAPAYAAWPVAPGPVSPGGV